MIRAAFDDECVSRISGVGIWLLSCNSPSRMVLETVYGHLSKFLVSVDDIMQAGDPVALK